MVFIDHVQDFQRWIERTQTSNFRPIVVQLQGGENPAFTYIGSDLTSPWREGMDSLHAQQIPMLCDSTEISRIHQRSSLQRHLNALLFGDILRSLLPRVSPVKLTSAQSRS